ncbi:hypothetical protein SDRG_16902 [Saprolegnia diclina VS20]|uniref:C2 domain-containing protein n=1 Tax=Saprolegnia diclina (strain VS20) TaxID=1156394 RepID=T0PSJ4_SAPDV|nr:hypothetical protein SDRG_16902 [Saprolegnia diclina VS20]EQC25231.1 hypothetical protein SDRG_16902 [Saprolegnia diclina VS20]|eukprot:XP_008621348.1 hypothetical protein SDRG_16902 [Saprolegnia diclina VS20]
MDVGVHRRRRPSPTKRLRARLPPVASNNHPCLDDAPPDDDGDEVQITPIVVQLEPLPVYHNLLTYPLLVRAHTRAMHDAGFVQRSIERWQTRATRPEDAIVARAAVRGSAATAIQSIWRTHVAVHAKRDRVEALLTLQTTRANWVQRHRPSLLRQLQALHANVRLCDRKVVAPFGLLSAYYVLPVWLLQWQLHFHTGRRRGQFLRRPVQLTRFVTFAVDATTHLVHVLWRQLTHIAVLVLQCAQRSRWARDRAAYQRRVRARHQAATCLQCAWRQWAARNEARRRRRYVAARRVQCAWRCAAARRCAARLLFNRTSRLFIAALFPVVLASAAQKLLHAAAARIQRVQRGRAARSAFRQIALQNAVARWAQDPDRGHSLYAMQCYFDAALVFEQCFLSGHPGSPRFYTEWATSHFYVYEATGDVFNLDRAILAFEQLMPSETDANGFTWCCYCMHVQARFFRHEFEKALALGVDCLERAPVTLEKDWRASVLFVCAMVALEGKALERCAMYLETALALLPLTTCPELSLRFTLSQVYSLLADARAVEISTEEAERAKLAEKAAREKSPSTDDAVATPDTLTVDAVGVEESAAPTPAEGTDNPHDSKTTKDAAEMTNVGDSTEMTEVDDAASPEATRPASPQVNGGGATTAMNTTPEGTSRRLEPPIDAPLVNPWPAKAAHELATCFAITELRMGQGVYHGVLSDAAAEVLLHATPPGTFLVYRKKTASRYLYVKVKWPDETFTSMKIQFLAGAYSHAQVSVATDASLVGFLQQLPAAAGIDVTKGLRKAGPHPIFGPLFSSSTEWVASNQPWLEVAHSWDLQSAYVLSAFVAARAPSYRRHVALEIPKAIPKTGWHLPARKSSLVLRDEAETADAYLLLAKAARGLQRKMDSLVLVQQAAHLDPRHECIRRSYVSQISAVFEPALKKLQKLDRFVGYALNCDTYAVTSRGDPGREVLLLEALDREWFGPSAPPTFLRRLLRAHVRAYAIGPFDAVHLELAIRAADRLHNALCPARPGGSLPRVRVFGPSVPSKKLKSKSNAKMKLKASQMTTVTMPLAHLFEVAEVIYRVRRLPAAIDHLRLVVQRLRALPPNPMHLHMMQMTQIRLAFLYQQIHRMDLAIEAINHVQVLSAKVGTRPPPLLWPSRMSYHLSPEEAQFLRGMLRELAHEDGAHIDYAPLHSSLIERVKRSLLDEQRLRATAEYRGSHLQSLIVTVGESLHLPIASILHAHLRVVIKCEGVVAVTEESPSWESLEPNWEHQQVRLRVRSRHATALVRVLSRHMGRDTCLGLVAVPIESLLENGGLPPTAMTLRVPASVTLRRPNLYPTLVLGFQLTTLAPTRTAEADEARLLPFSLPDFLNLPFVWERFAHRFVSNGDSFLARPFLLQALRRHTPPYSLQTIRCMLSLARCEMDCKANPSALEWLQKAHAALVVLPQRDGALEDSAIALMTQCLSPDSLFRKQLLTAQEHPICHEYVRMRYSDGDYYVDKATGECLTEAPLGFEANPPAKPRLQRMVLFAPAMKQRIAGLRREMLARAAADPDQWSAIFDETHGRMFYISAVHALQTFKRPSAYVMVADEHTVYSVLLIQDLFRLRRLRARVRRLLRRAIRVVRIVVYMVTAEKARAEARRIRATKVPLNCIKVMIEYAEDLRAADRVSSDPFVTLDITTNGNGPRPRSRQTSVQPSTLTPIWNELFHIPYAWLQHEVDPPRKRPTHAKTAEDEEADDKDEDDDDDAPGDIDMDRVTKALAINLVENDASLHDDIDDERSLVLTVWDFDAPVYRTRAASREFLGLAVVPLDALDHGMPISAELTLRDEDGYLSPRPRGTLNMTVQWIAYCFPRSLRSVMLATWAIARLSRLLAITYAKRVVVAKPKPPLSDELQMLLELVDSTFHTALLKLADVIVMADQLQRLKHRLSDARKGQTTADEEKHIELRLQAVMRDQFGPKQRKLLDTKADLANCLKSFAKLTSGTIAEYIASVDATSSIAERVGLWLNELGLYDAKHARLSSWQATQDETAPQPITFDAIMTFVLDEKHTFVVWEAAVKGLVAEAFTGGSWSFDMTKELAVCRKIEDTLLATNGEARGPDDVSSSAGPAQREKLDARKAKRLQKLSKKAKSRQ